MSSREEEFDENNNQKKLNDNLKKFSQYQQFNINLELEKEEEETLSIFENFDITYLENKGILIKNTVLFKKGFTSYGKINFLLKSIHL